jgi:hypothetical protein
MVRSGYTDTPIEIAGDKNITGVVITLTDRVTTLTGTITEAGGQPAATAGVVVFPAERALWRNFGNQPRRIRFVTASTRGTFSVRGLPAGDYLAVAIDDSYGDKWQDPSFLEAASRLAARFTLNWSETTAIEVKLQEIR